MTRGLREGERGGQRELPFPEEPGDDPYLVDQFSQQGQAAVHDKGKPTHVSSHEKRVRTETGRDSLGQGSPEARIGSLVVLDEELLVLLARLLRHPQLDHPAPERPHEDVNFRCTGRTVGSFVTVPAFTEEKNFHHLFLCRGIAVHRHYSDLEIW